VRVFACNKWWKKLLQTKQLQLNVNIYFGTLHSSVNCTIHLDYVKKNKNELFFNHILPSNRTVTKAW
jgi:hypothetical protein